MFLGCREGMEEKKEKKALCRRRIHSRPVFRQQKLAAVIQNQFPLLCIPVGVEKLWFCGFG